MPRAQKAAVTAAATLAPPPAEFDFTKSYQKLKPDAFYRFCNEYPNKDGLQLYAYRCWPVVVRKPKYITKLDNLAETPIDEEFFARQFGSGEYKLILNDQNRPTKLNEMATCMLRIRDPQRPPLVVPEELDLNAPDNRSFIEEMKSKGVRLGSEANMPNETEAVAVKGLLEQNQQLTQTLIERKPEGRIEEKQLDFVTKVYETLMAKQIGQQADPMEQALKIVALLKDKPQREESGLTERLIALLEKRHEGAPVDPLAAYERVAAVIQKTGGSGSGGGWMDALAHLPKLLEMGARMFEAMAVSRSMQQAAHAVPAPAALPAPASNVVAMPAPAPAISLPVLTPEQELDLGSPVNLASLQLLAQRALTAFGRGVGGDTFAASLCVTEADERWYDLMAASGKEGILAALSLVPDMAAHLEPRKAELEAWVGEFVGYGAAEESPERKAA